MTIYGKTYAADSLDYFHPCPLYKRITANQNYTQKKKEGSLSSKEGTDVAKVEGFNHGKKKKRKKIRWIKE